MQKLKNVIISKMIESRLTSSEINFLLYLSHIQDDEGNVYGIHHADVKSIIGIYNDTFYRAINHLSELGFITASQTEYGDWNITILNNDFSYKNATKEGYVSTGHDVFYFPAFLKLKANEKLLALWLFRSVGFTGEKKYHKNMDEFCAEIGNMLGCKPATIRRYLTHLKKFFNILVYKKEYVIYPNDKCEKWNAPSDAEKLEEHAAMVITRRNQATYTTKQLGDTTHLITQYAAKVQNVVDLLFKAVNQSIITINNQIRLKKNWNRQLQPAHIHKALLSMI